jgi:hypothetical protein
MSALLRRIFESKSSGIANIESSVDVDGDLEVVRRAGQTSATHCAKILT